MTGSIEPSAEAGAPGRPEAFMAWMRRRKQAIADRIVMDVPAALVSCEFDCSETRCAPGRWIACERRLKGEAQALRR